MEREGVMMVLNTRSPEWIETMLSNTSEIHVKLWLSLTNHAVQKHEKTAASVECIKDTPSHYKIHKQWLVLVRTANILQGVKVWQLKRCYLM